MDLARGTVAGDGVASVMPENWNRWSAWRPPSELLHLDCAAAGRASERVLAVTAEHATLEARRGAYVAEAEAQETLATARGSLAGLLGLPPDGLAFVESATAGLATLLATWPFSPGSRVGVVRAEWGPNLEAFQAAGLTAEFLPSDDAGHIDLDGLEQALRKSPPALIHLTQVASHRGLVQPVEAAARLCRAAGVPMWTDAAQAIGHVDTACDADAMYATSRKWLSGPRGVGLIGVAPRAWSALRVRNEAMLPDDLPVVQALESREAHVAGRIGLGQAVTEYLAAGPRAVRARLAAVGSLTHDALSDLGGWTVAATGPSECAITSIRPTAGQSVPNVRARLLAEHGIVTTACSTARAPHDMREPLLRISPHVDLSADHLERLCSALAACSA